MNKVDNVARNRLLEAALAGRAAEVEKRGNVAQRANVEVSRGPQRLPGGAAERTKIGRPGGHLRGPAGASRATRTRAILVLAVAALALSAASRPARASTAESLLIRGLERVETEGPDAAIPDIEAAVGVRPDWSEARWALGTALLGAGRAREASVVFAVLVGEGEAEAIASGGADADTLAPGTEPEHLLGLAAAREALGRTREADRLYRAFADLVGPTSPAAARAHLRLAAMYERTGVAWGDPAAERAKADALAPGAGADDARLRYPDLGGSADAGPYLRPLAVGPTEEAGGFDSLPVLVSWAEPVLPPDTRPFTAERTVTLEILVDEGGAVADVRVVEDTGAGCQAQVAAAVAAARSRFEPAVRDGVPVAAWILFDVVYPPFLSLGGAGGEDEGRQDGRSTGGRREAR